MKYILRKIKILINYIKTAQEKNIYKPFYKLVEILEEDEQYITVIKVINKNITFNATPEELLANDQLVDQFSPRDIRTLTYLGYLGINGPKYKILAKKLSQNDKITFLIKKKGEKKIIAKTADQIIQEKNMITHMNAEDAKVIGYTVGAESISEENKQKEALRNEK